MLELHNIQFNGTMEASVLSAPKIRTGHAC